MFQKWITLQETLSTEFYVPEENAAFEVLEYLRAITKISKKQMKRLTHKAGYTLEISLWSDQTDL